MPAFIAGVQRARGCGAIGSRMCANPSCGSPVDASGVIVNLQRASKYGEYQIQQ
jgi:hypothetical protein